MTGRAGRHVISGDLGSLMARCREQSTKLRPLFVACCQLATTGRPCDYFLASYTPNKQGLLHGGEEANCLHLELGGGILAWQMDL